ncbi:MAG: TldD/PmbA family protein [Candidatus Thorarchaeota archaeon]
MVDLISIAEKAVRKALQLGAEQVEAYAAYSRSFAIEVENNAIKTAVEKRDAGIGIRSVIDKKIGFAYVTTLQEDDYEEAVMNSVKLAKASIPDPDFLSLPSMTTSYPAVNGLFDKDVAELSSEEAAEMVIRSVDASKDSVKGMKVATESQLTTSAGSKAIVNSLGISQKAESTSIMMYCYPSVKSDNDQSASFEYQVSRSLRKIDPEWIGRTASENAVKSLDGITIDGGDMPVVLSPLAVGTIIGGGFAGAVNAEEVQYGRSYISDAFGSTIASESLSIIDDGTLEGGTGSRNFDGEGFPSQKTPILENGILKSLLHNSYSANKDNVPNTGNASRPSYAGIPSISPSNFMVNPGNGSLDDLVGEITKGVLCLNTGDRPNMTTGDLSAMIMEGFLIENGEIGSSLKNTLIGINMRDLLLRVSRIGADVREGFSIISPSLVIESAKVTSG